MLQEILVSEKINFLIATSKGNKKGGKKKRKVFQLQGQKRENNMAEVFEDILRKGYGRATTQRLTPAQVACRTFVQENIDHILFSKLRERHLREIVISVGGFVGSDQDEPLTISHFSQLQFYEPYDSLIFFVDKFDFLVMCISQGICNVAEGFEPRFREVMLRVIVDAAHVGLNLAVNDEKRQTWREENNIGGKKKKTNGDEEDNTQKKQRKSVIVERNGKMILMDPGMQKKKGLAKKGKTASSSDSASDLDEEEEEEEEEEESTSSSSENSSSDDEGFNDDLSFYDNNNNNSSSARRKKMAKKSQQKVRYDQNGNVIVKQKTFVLDAVPERHSVIERKSWSSDKFKEMIAQEERMLQEEISGMLLLEQKKKQEARNNDSPIASQQHQQNARRLVLTVAEQALIEAEDQRSQVVHFVKDRVDADKKRIGLKNISAY